MVVTNVTNSIFPALFQTALATEDTTYIIRALDQTSCIAVFNANGRGVGRTVCFITAANHAAYIIAGCLNIAEKGAVTNLEHTHRLGLSANDAAHSSLSVDCRIAGAVLHSTNQISNKCSNTMLASIVSNDYSFLCLAVSYKYRVCVSIRPTN